MNLDYAGLAALILAAVTLYRTFRTVPREDKKLEADAAQQFQEIAAMVGEKNKELIERIHSSEEKIDQLEAEVKRLSRLITEWEIGINKLCDQLHDVGIEPVWTPKKRGR